MGFIIVIEVKFFVFKFILRLFDFYLFVCFGKLILFGFSCYFSGKYWDIRVLYWSILRFDVYLNELEREILVSEEVYLYLIVWEIYCLLVNMFNSRYYCDRILIYKKVVVIKIIKEFILCLFLFSRCLYL